MKHLLIIHHTQSGNTLKLAHAVRDGAELEEGVKVRFQRAFDSTLEDLQWCDALLIGTPEYNGYMSGAVKDFLDRTYYPAQETVRDNLPYAVFVSAGNDGTNAVRFIERIARGYPLKKVAEPLVVVGEVTPQALEECSELGQTVAAGLTLGIF